MGELIFMISYIAIMILLVVAEIYLLSNDKVRYLNTSYKALSNICSKNRNDESYDLGLFANEINRFYDEYVQEVPKIKKFFPNVVMWIDSIIFSVDCGNKRADVLKEHVSFLKDARDRLEQDNPFNKCERHQQDILRDISRMETNENEIVVQNIIKRTEEEFIRLCGDARKNEKANKISIAIGIIGIVVSIIMGAITF